MRARKMIRVALSALVVPVVLLCFSASALAVSGWRVEFESEGDW